MASIGPIVARAERSAVSEFDNDRTGAGPPRRLSDQALSAWRAAEGSEELGEIFASGDGAAWLAFRTERERFQSVSHTGSREVLSGTQRSPRRRPPQCLNIQSSISGSDWSSFTSY